MVSTAERCARGLPRAGILGWLGVTTNASGEASIDVKLPESLTTYRIMAVAADRVSRFGNGDAEVRVNKPLTMKPAFPRFLAVGDKALFGAVVTSQLRGRPARRR